MRMETTGKKMKSDHFILNECLAITPNGDLARGLCIKQEFRFGSALCCAARSEGKQTDDLKDGVPY
ncbi:MAG: hypothetical protein V8S86_02990, partial [Eubacteriales bacterium]